MIRFLFQEKKNLNLIGLDSFIRSSIELVAMCFFVVFLFWLCSKKADNFSITEAIFICQLVAVVWLKAYRFVCQAYEQYNMSEVLFFLNFFFQQHFLI